MFPKLYFTVFNFETRVRINNLPFFQGIIWSSLFRNAWNSLQTGISFQETGIKILPSDQGVPFFPPQINLEIGVMWSSEHHANMERLAAILKNPPVPSPFSGHINPGKTVILKSIMCRISGRVNNFKQFRYIKPSDMESSIHVLTMNPEITIRFHTPLRMTRPAGTKTPGHMFIDEQWLMINSTGFNHIFESIISRNIESSNSSDSEKALPDEIISPSNGTSTSENFPSETDQSELTVPETSHHRFETKRSFFKWIDVPYGMGPGAKTIGGVVGSITVLKPKLTRYEASRLVTAQFFGIGKNTTMGFGQYEIMELSSVSPIKPLKRAVHLLETVLNRDFLMEQLPVIEDKSPGPDGIPPAYFKTAGPSAFDFLISQVKDGTYKHAPPEEHAISKKDGGKRLIYISNASDRVLQRAAAVTLARSVDPMLSTVSNAYRKGRGRQTAIDQFLSNWQKGLHYGFKADIRSFFDETDLKTLFEFLNSLFYEDKLITLIESWYHYPWITKGLCQGNPLSPVLSNIFLDVFDRLVTEHFELIRYSDDFIVQFISSGDHDAAMSHIKTVLTCLGLELHPDKLTLIAPDKEFVFLGYNILNGEKVEQAQGNQPDTMDPMYYEPPAENDEVAWNSLVDRSFVSYRTVYVTSATQKVTTEGNTLRITKYNADTENIPWSEIRQIITVGKQRVSGGVFSRALEEGVPIYFQQLMGGPTAHFITNRQVWNTNIHLWQYKRFADPEYCLQWAKNVIRAKIMNLASILRRRGDDRRFPNWYSESLDTISKTTSLDELRGVEGYYSRLYFAEFAKYTAPFSFPGRIYHPPDGPVNAMLSLGYTLIYNRLNAALLRVGLDTRCGFMHAQKGRHACLASDLMEEMRYLVDRMVLNLISSGAIKPLDFTTEKESFVSSDTFRTVIRTFERTMDRRFTSPFTGDNINMNEYLDEISQKVVVSLKLGMPYIPKAVK